MKRYLALLALPVLLSGCGGSNPNVEIEASNEVNPIFGVHYVRVKVKAIADEVEIQDVVVNRGNCPIEQKTLLPIKLKFGQSITVIFSAPCEVTQVDVATNDGSWGKTY